MPNPREQAEVVFPWVVTVLLISHIETSNLEPWFLLWSRFWPLIVNVSHIQMSVTINCACYHGNQVTSQPLLLLTECWKGKTSNWIPRPALSLFMSISVTAQADVGASLSSLALKALNALQSSSNNFQCILRFRPSNSPCRLIFLKIFLKIFPAKGRSLALIPIFHSKHNDPR